jgi:hypothetical protein
VATAARLLVGTEVYRHVLFVCSTTMALQAEKQEKAPERTPILAQLFVPLLLGAHLCQKLLPLLQPPPEEPKPRIGFHTDQDK